ncbi:cyclodeaminase/cyclohydrolase family protein [Streptomyces coffeae]|uniref:Cyclodeaminase/cyclohydrolase family protein n=1 Tax=Streptomyces coffeae TaxID=621382 RepID=A0ABS1NPC3_9ACTN|nr:cyclodeaminase/cyclohydrolase family protein [Streptomyces coffeae]MBL1101941.1 cyclodeaminase/cyclohydrolase family protein [Streptomyces coffeae]
MRDETIGDFLTQLAARVPAPGGGAVAALHAAQAAALVGMVARYSTGEKYAEHQDIIERVTAESDRLRNEALRLAEADVTAFAAVAEAYQLPKDTDEAKAARSAAIARALADAGRPPAEVVGVAQVVIELAEELLPFGNRNVITDVAAAAEAARAAATTARVNIEINLGGVRDEMVYGELTAAAAWVPTLVARAERVTAAVRERIAA